MRFENTDELRSAEFVNVDLTSAYFENVNLQGARLKDVMLVNVKMSGLIEGLTVNDIEVGPLIRSEMDRRHPERVKLVPSGAEGAREAWSVIEGIWASTLQRAGDLPEPVLHERVDGEWSFLETVRHLIFVIDAWISGNVLGRSQQFHPLGVPPSFILDPAAMGIDVGADPSLAEVIPVREERADVVRALVADLNDDDLSRPCGEHTMLRCLLTLFDEEWHHNWFANRDLDTLDPRR